MHLSSVKNACASYSSNGRKKQIGPPCGSAFSDGKTDPTPLDLLSDLINLLSDILNLLSDLLDSLSNLLDLLSDFLNLLSDLLDLLFDILDMLFNPMHPPSWPLLQHLVAPLTVFSCSDKIEALGALEVVGSENRSAGNSSVGPGSSKFHH